jgi:hypothetical protein
MNRLLACLVVAALLAGCAQTSSDTTLPGGPGLQAAGADASEARMWAAHPGVALPAGVEPVQARFAYAGPLNLTTVKTGTFAPQQVCPLGCFSKQQYAPIDVSDALPVGMPLQVTAELEAASFTGTLLFVDAPPEDRLDEAGNEPSATGARAVFFLQRNGDGPVRLNVLHGDPGDDPDLSYALTLYVEVLTTRFDARTPIAVPVPAGATAIAVEAATPGGDVRAWDGKDAYLGNWSLASGFALLPVQQPGEHVLQFSGATAALHVWVLAPTGAAAPLLRSLAFARTPGEVHEATGATPVEWTFDTGGVPLGAGVTLAAPEDTALMALAGAKLDLRAPGGLLLTRIESDTCLCAVAFSSGAWGSDVPAGTYTVGYASTGSAHAMLGHFVDRYVR